MKTVWLLLALFAIVPALAGKPVAPGVSAARYARLSRGVNLGAYRYQPDLPINDDLLAQLHRTGFRHVRLTVNPAPLFNEDDPGVLNPAGVAKFDPLLDRILANGLGVIVDMHDPDKRLWNDDAYAAKFTVFWEALAKHLSRRNPDMVFLETANEPLSDTPEHWNALQERLLAAMRRGGPRNTLVATPNMQVSPGQWDQWAALQTLYPVPDKNVVYNVHIYDPFWFTHQGATWTGTQVKALRGVPYPSTPENVAPLLPALPEDVQNIIRDYGNQRWNTAKLDEDVAKYAQWAEARRVRLTINEFGVYKAVSPPADRAAWLHDIRAALDHNRVSWTMWDDGGGFGVTSRKQGAWVLDNDALKALGMNEEG